MRHLTNMALITTLGCSGGGETSVEAAGGSTGDTGASAGSEVTGPPPGTSSDTTSPGDSGTSTGIAFIWTPDSSAAPGCDLFAQDCAAGEKCMPWANDGGNAWNATRCSPLFDNPGQPGDECTVEGSGVSGIDSCDLGAMCWDVDPETNIGTCASMCSGDEANPICEDPSTSCAILNDGAIVLCLPTCDPVLQDCVEGLGCYPMNDAWNCAPDASGEPGAFGDPCAFINTCDPGLVCLNAPFVPGCSGTEGCCSEVCDVSSSLGNDQCQGASGGQSCEPWYVENAPPGFENVGVCVLPG